MRTSICALLLITIVSGLHAGQLRRIDFSMSNGRDTPHVGIVRVSLPAPVGLIRGEPQSVLRGTERISAQARVITRHPDGSVRRMILSFPVRLEPKSIVDFRCGPDVDAAVQQSLAKVNGTAADITVSAAITDVSIAADDLSATTGLRAAATRALQLDGQLYWRPFRLRMGQRPDRPHARYRFPVGNCAALTCG